MTGHAAAAPFQFGGQHGGAIAIRLHEASDGALQGLAPAPQGDAALPVNLARCGSCRRARRRRRHGDGDIEQARDFRRQLVHFQRLRGKAVHAGRLRGAPVLLQHAGRQGDDGRRLQALFALVHADQARRFQAVHARHLHVHQDDIETALGKFAHGALAIAGGDHLVASRAQADQEQLHILRHVVGRQDAQRRQGHHGLLAAARHGLARRQRQQHVEHAAHAQGAFHRDGAVHQFDQLQRDRRAQARAAKAAAHRRISLREGGEDLVEAVGGNADARVVHGDVHLLALHVDGHAHVAHFRELDGVADQIGQHLLHPARVAEEELPHARVDIHMQHQVARVRRDAQRRGHMVDQVRQRKVHQFQLGGPLFQLGRVEDVVEQFQQRARRLAHRAQVAALQAVQGGTQQHFREADDGVHRGADFMAHVGQEAGLRFGCQFGAVFRRAQVFLHGAALAHVGGKFHHLERLAVRVEDRVVRRLYPHFLAMLADALVFGRVELALRQLLPECRVGGRGYIVRFAKDAVVQAQHVIELVADQVEEVLVGRQYAALQVEFADGQRARNGRHLAFVFGIAQFAFRDVQDDAVDPAHHAVVVQHRAAALAHPAFAPVAVQHAVDVLEVALVIGRLHAGVVDALAVVRMHQVEQPDAPFDEVLRHPPRQVEDGVADENHLPLGCKAAVERDAGNVADQGAVLAFAVLERLLHVARRAHVRDEGHEQGLARHIDLADRHAHGQHAAIAVAPFQLPSAVEDARRARFQVVAQVALVLARVGRLQQYAGVAAHDLRFAPAKQRFGGRIEGTHLALAIDGDQAIGGRVDDGAQARLAGAGMAQQLAVAQQAVRGGDENGQGDGDQGHGQRHERRLHGDRVVAQGWRAGKTRRQHARVVHAGDGQAHHHAADQQGRDGIEALAHGVQAKAYPQRQHGHGDGHQQRQRKQPRLIMQGQRGLHGGHAAVMHGTDAHADQHAAHHQLAPADARACQQVQRHPRRGHAGQHGQQGQAGIEGDARADVEGQHADEVHRPDAAAQRDGARDDGRLALEATLAAARHAGDLQGHERGKDGDADGKQHQPVVMRAIDIGQRIARGGKHGTKHTVVT
ncbi:hypothetical protein JaAD80_10195 [Janthinobacterium sp. AD80]|nr:hypothetical protein JaAD80_10195 [Janthinobacterium sp. AD80]